MSTARSSVDDYPETAETIAAAKAANRRERIQVAQETGWIFTADGELVDPLTLGVQLGEAMAVVLEHV
jgi:hypothetical protein